MKSKRALSVLLSAAMACSVVGTTLVNTQTILTNSVYAAEDESSGVGGFVDRLYTLTLGRKPDNSGYEYWVSQLKEGSIDGGTCAFGFLFSDEFTNKNVSNEEYVDTLYHVFFDRNPDSEGLAYWVQMLNNGDDKMTIFAGFVNSTEWAELCAKYGIQPGSASINPGPNSQADDIETFVRSLYRDCLGRDADTNGLNDWVNRLTTGEITGKEAAYGFFFSPEFIDRGVAYYDKEELSEYVSLYYRVFLNREPDQDGLNYWVDKTFCNYYVNLILFEGFSDSKEFANKCEACGITPGKHINVGGSDDDFTYWAMSFSTSGANWNNLLEYVLAGYTSASPSSMAPHFPYVYGGLSLESGIDCSGLIVYFIQTYHNVNNVPHHMLTMAQTYGTDISANEIRPGDLICDGSGDHGWVYLYVGRIGPDCNGNYHDFYLYGTSADWVFTEEKSYYESWMPVISEVSYTYEGEWESSPMTVNNWVTKDPNFRIARVTH
ncbi:MAG: DUF4214 domain-containing protein [Clostridia bacterium]|nr:DUF4214 domain-containing protein [Clostridia bacterium]